LVCEAIGTAATPGLLCQPRVIVKMIVEKQMECRLAGETEGLNQLRYCVPRRAMGEVENNGSDLLKHCFSADVLCTVKYWILFLLNIPELSWCPFRHENQIS
jgi:hypothetical protein